jgi:ABC-type phosphate transport system permease subunit
MIESTADAAIQLRTRRSWRSIKNALMTGVMVSGFVVIAIPLVAILWSVIARGAHAAFGGFPDFVTREIPRVSRFPGPGMGPVMSDNYFCRSTTTRFAGSSTSGQRR